MKTIKYVAVDAGGLQSNVATVTVIIGPIAHDDGTYVVKAGDTLTIGKPAAAGATGVLTDDDPVPGIPLTRAVVDRIDFDHNEYHWYGNGAFTYHAGAGTSKPLLKTIWYRAVDADGHASNVATVTIRVTPKK